MHTCLFCFKANRYTVHSSPLFSFLSTFPLRGHGNRVGVLVCFTWAKSGYTPGRVATSSQGSTGHFWGFCTLLKGTLAVLWRCSGTSSATCTPFNLLPASQTWTKKPSPSQPSPLQTALPPPLPNTDLIIKNKYSRYLVKSENFRSLFSQIREKICSWFYSYPLKRFLAKMSPLTKEKALLLKHFSSRKSASCVLQAAISVLEVGGSRRDAVSFRKDASPKTSQS